MNPRPPFLFDLWIVDIGSANIVQRRTGRRFAWLTSFCTLSCEPQEIGLSMTSSCAVAVRRSCAVHVLGSCDGRWALLATMMMNDYSGGGSITLLSTTSDLSPRVFWLCAASRRLVSAQPGITLAWTPFHHAGHVLLIQEMCRDMQAVKRIGLMLVVFAISGIVKFRRLVRSTCKPLLHYDSLVR